MPTNVPLTAAQVMASQRSTSGSAGLAGGFLPVAARHEVLSPFFAIAAAASAATSDMTDQTFEDCAMLGPYPAAEDSVSSASARARSSGCRVLISQYGAGSAGSVISTWTARFR